MAKTVLITGCSSGIGAALVHSFHKRGLTVFATARNPSSLSSFSALNNVHVLALDVTSESSAQEAYAQIKIKTGGKLDYLVNNAGRGYEMPALDNDVEEGKRLFDTNFWGVVRMINVFAPLVAGAKGTIVNIGSGAGVIHLPYKSLYGASKAALHLLSETLRLELAPLGVSVITVVVGAVATSFHANLAEPKLPEDSLYRPVEKQYKAVAKGETETAANHVTSDVFADEVVSDVLAGKDGKIYRGKQAGTVWWANRFFPTWLTDRIILKGSGLDKWSA